MVLSIILIIPPNLWRYDFQFDVHIFLVPAGSFEMSMDQTNLGRRRSLGHHCGLLCLGHGRLGDYKATAGRTMVATLPTFVGSCLSRQKCWRIQRSSAKHREGCGNFQVKKTVKLKIQVAWIGMRHTCYTWIIVRSLDVTPKGSRESSLISGTSRLVKIYMKIL